MAKRGRDGHGNAEGMARAGHCSEEGRAEQGLGRAAQGLGRAWAGQQCRAGVGRVEQRRVARARAAALSALGYRAGPRTATLSTLGHRTGARAVTSSALEHRARAQTTTLDAPETPSSGSSSRFEHPGHRARARAAASNAMGHQAGARAAPSSVLGRTHFAHLQHLCVFARICTQGSGFVRRAVVLSAVGTKFQRPQRVQSMQSTVSAAREF